MSDPDRPASTDPFTVLDETRKDFVATFNARCDTMRALVDDATQTNAGDAIASLTQAVHRLTGLAGTIGFPTISQRASDFEALLGNTGAPFDPIAAAALVEQVRAALDVDMAAHAWAPADVTMAPAEKLTVLIADDDPDVTRIVDAQLRAAGYTTLLAFDGEQTLAAIHDQAPDVVVLDLMMPRLSGFEVLAQLRDAPPPRPRVIVLSARGREEDRIRGFELGAADYLTKPFNPQELTERIARLLK